jgi:hypothetical protein
VRYGILLIALLSFDATAALCFAQQPAVGSASPQDAPLAFVPADVQIAPLLSPSYQAPAPPGPYGNVQAQWIENGPVPVPMPEQLPPGALLPGAQPQGAPPTFEMAPSDVSWPRWAIDAELLVISRDNESRPRRIGPRLFATDPQFDAVAAPDIAISRYVDPEDQWQLRYFNAANQEGDAHNATIDVPHIDLQYFSNLQNAEINYIHTWYYWSFIGGFRYIHLDERFYDYFYNNFGEQYAIDQFTTQNNLFGGQVGFNIHREWHWLTFDDTLKFGLYGNFASQGDAFSNHGATYFQWSNHPAGVADALEIDLALGHRFSPNLIGRIGLMVLAIDGVALAHDVEFTSSADGSVTMLGLRMGVTATW